MDEAEYCERLSIMAEGELKLIGSPTELKNKMDVETIDDLFEKFVNR